MTVLHGGIFRADHMPFLEQNQQPRKPAFILLTFILGFLKTRREGIVRRGIPSNPIRWLVECRKFPSTVQDVARIENIFRAFLP